MQCNINTYNNKSDMNKASRAMNTRLKLNEEMMTQVVGGTKQDRDKEKLFEMLEACDVMGIPYEFTDTNGIRYYTDGNGRHSVSVS